MIQALMITTSLLNAAQIVVGLSNDTQFIVGGYFMAVDLSTATKSSVCPALWVIEVTC